MQSKTNRLKVEAQSKQQRRYWRRTGEPAGWWPAGSLPLLGLVFLFLYGALRTAPAIEADTESRVAAALGETGVDVLAVSGDGQAVNIVAAASESAEVAIRGTASLTECATWVGELRCPTDIKVALQAPVEPPRYHDFQFSRVDDTVRLQGEVATTDEQARLSKAAHDRFDVVVDHLIVSNEAATSGYGPASDRALMLLDRFDSGSVRWAQGVLSATGQVQAANEDMSREIFERDDAALSLSLGEIDLEVISSASHCNEEFASLLGNASVRFRTGSAVIDDSSRTLLAELAAVAKRCPGQIVIEGHTDDVGSADANQSLSLSRAEAVRNAFSALGIPTDRLTSVGHGETRPVASNATRAGRAENRRIAIQVAESGAK